MENDYNVTTRFTIVVEKESVQIRVAGLHMAPSRRWLRDRNDNGTYIFHRELLRKEVYELLCIKKAPEGMEQIQWANPEFHKQVAMTGEELEPAIKLTEEKGQLMVLFQLMKPTSKATFPPPRDLENAIKRGYAINNHMFLTFDPEGVKSTKKLFQKLRLPDLASRPYPISFREYRRIKETVANNEAVVLLNEVNEDAFLEDLKTARKQSSVVQPGELTINLYPYQKKALDWLCFCHNNELGGVLADDMGLGKTATVIAFLAATKSEKPSLVCCPSTLLANWLQEFEKFCPSLDVNLHHGANRIYLNHDFPTGAVVLTSYGLLRNDVETLACFDWNLIALDEAQTIKNPESGVSQACRKYQARCRVAMTGTPFENRPLDLWTLMDFVEPGYLGNRDFFEHTYATPIAGGSTESINQLESKIKLLMMRRLKSEVQGDLPDKIEIEQPVRMPEDEVRLYRETVETLKVRAKERGTPANLITPLRQLCCHPSLVEDDLAKDPSLRSAKYRKFIYLLEQIKERGEKALAFASFTGMLDLLQVDVAKRLGIPTFRIDGGVPVQQRQPTVEEYSNVVGPALMVLNPTAGGVGLNITAANHVFHYNREWNPAREDQATDRAYRIGQEKEVCVHYMYYENTIEELVSRRLEKKRDLAGGLITVTDEKESDQALVLEALSLLPSSTINDQEDENTNQTPDSQ